MEIVSRLVKQRLKEQDSEEERYKKLDERIRNCQQSRREVPQRQKKIWEKEEKGKKDGRKKKGLRKNGFILFLRPFIVFRYNKY